ncbi:hypothetical protein DFP72DRAFT_1031967 [Ephemerocybe angulata]|uniref:Cupredoxin n=1 Tax=Ephemerocybe angulata TaxID=980116 RepID=A0A8H6MAU4_9AGAR|nr:hypothetical protein DFP72DRAFT_1031967 [Tulosesus angulatus]
MRSPSLALGLIILAPSVLGAMVDVNVGANGQLAYDPPSIQAMAGDIVRFHFVPVQAGTDPLPVQEFTVPDNGGTPLWFYCGQTAHCGQGMVFAINAPQDPDPHSFNAFKALAIARNGTAASTTTAPPTSTTTTSTSDNYTTPPPPKWTEATKTITWNGQTYTTTYTSYDGTPDPTPAVTPQEHRIVVGAAGQLMYSPANITAQINDTVVFEFHPKNHTVTQSSFSTPCEGLPNGFKSGFKPTDATVTDNFPTFSIKITDTAPIWGYCGQVGHCQAGMVFAINAVESGLNNFAAFQQLAQRPTNSSSQTGGGGTTAGTNGTSSGSGKNGNGADASSPAFGISVFTLLIAGVLAMLL